MFREINQKKQHIISRIFAAWCIGSYVMLTVSFCFLPQKVGSAAITVDSKPYLEQQSSIKNFIEVTPPIIVVPEKTETQAEIESEVIDEYFDDAHGSGLAVPSVNTSFKSYTYYTKLNKRSNQWKLQQKAYTDEHGLRKIKDFYLVAMGSYYSTTLGDTFKITTANGNEFKVMLCDYKSNKHTDKKHMYTVENNCMVEFYVDGKKLNNKIKRSGTIGKIPQFSGKVTKVEYLGHYEWK